jgi:dihydrofolate reductase
MGRLIVVQFITLDGVVEDPDGTGGTPYGGWAMHYGPQGVAGDKFRLGPILEHGILLFGRRTWEHFSTLWPRRDDPFSRRMNAATKVVVTHSRIDAGAWANSQSMSDPLEPWSRNTVRTRDVVVIGSTSIVAQLQAADVVDEYRLLTFPVALGAGRPLFPEGVQLNLISAEPVGPATLGVYATHSDSTS